MPVPLTADERERRFVQYISTLNKDQLSEVRLTRLNRIANFRHRMMDLMNELIEARAEELAAGMLMQYAPERPKKEPTVIKGRLPLVERKRVRPKWVADNSQALTNSLKQQ